MSTQSAHGRFLSIRDIAVIGVMVATIEVAKITLSFLPNIELVTLLVMLYTICFGWKTLYAIAVFVLIEGCLYGFGLWWFFYLYAWPLLFIITHCFRKQKSVFVFMVISGFFGLFFGGLSSVPYFIVGGLRMGVSYWFAGIPFDLIHCAGNIVVCLILWKPLITVLQRLEPASE